MFKIKEKIIIAMFAIFVVSSYTYADVLDDILGNKTEQKKANLAKIKKEIDVLKKEQLELILKMHKLRLKLIKENPNLNKLHNKIIALHKELAIKIDQNVEMKQLIIKNISIDKKIKKQIVKKNEK